MDEAKYSWKRGLAVFVVLVLIGYLAGVFITKATAATPPDPASAVSGQTSADITCTNEASRCGTVKTKEKGVKKFKAGKLGNAKGIKYTKKQKRIFTTKLVRAWNRRNARMAAPHEKVQRVTRKWAWKNFTKNDGCVSAWSPSGTTTPDYWTCSKSYTPSDHDWTGRDVEVTFCSGLAAIGARTAIATGAASGPGAGWIWTGIGAGWAVCMWQDRLKRAADN